MLKTDWKDYLRDEFNKPYMLALQEFLKEESKTHQIAPPEDYYRALNLVSRQQTKVVILGQDPYPTLGHANGLAFAVNEGVKRPKSLQNIFKELSSDLNTGVPENNTLLGWTRQGVLLLNTVLTCRVGEPMSHRGRGWENFTDEVIRQLNQKERGVVFILWGKPAQEKIKLITNPQHPIIQSFHPSPLSANRGFFGSKPFSKANGCLHKLGYEAIDWSKTA